MTTRTRKSPGRIAFVGSGPGDTGLLTVRARELLEKAELVVTDPDVPASVLELADPEVEVRPAVGEPADVAKDLVTEAKAGRVVIRLVSGDPLTHSGLVAEAQAVARTTNKGGERTARMSATRRSSCSMLSKLRVNRITAPTSGCASNSRSSSVRVLPCTSIISGPSVMAVPCCLEIAQRLRTNNAADSTCAVCGNISITPAAAAHNRVVTRTPASRARLPDGRKRKTQCRLRT